MLAALAGDPSLRGSGGELRAAGREEMRGGEGGSSPSMLAEGERENEGRPVKEAEEGRDSGYSGVGLPF